MRNFEKNMEEFYRELPAIWLVFAGSYLHHGNKLVNLEDKSKSHTIDEYDDNEYKVPEKSEKLLVDLLLFYISTEFIESSVNPSFDQKTLLKLIKICDLLKLWSEDLEEIYKIRKNFIPSFQITLLAKRFLKRIQQFEKCTLIPNGLYSAKHTGFNESVNVAILKRNSDRIDWIQVNPGGLYHQRCPTRFAGEKSDAYFEIIGVDPIDISEEWLYLLIGLKSVKPGNKNNYYMEKSLYECLLAHLNGKTVFKTAVDDDFLFFSHTSPAHTWQVIEKTLRYLMKYFLIDEYYHNIMTGFKLFLMKNTFFAYQNENNKYRKHCHFLLLEMCRETAQQALDYGNLQQKSEASNCIFNIMETLKKNRQCEFENLSRLSHLGEPRIKSLNFTTPCLIQHAESSYENSISNLIVNPIFLKPKEKDDVIDYLKQFKSNFIDKLVNSSDFREISFLNYGIEVFFIDYLAQTDILQKSHHSFSRDDNYLAKTLKELAEIYFCTLERFVRKFLSDLTFKPQFYAKNITIQFFVYACVGSLAFRNERIRSILEMYNLSTSYNETLEFNKILPRLVINDARYLKIFMDIREFFKHSKDLKILFTSPFRFKVNNNSQKCNNDVNFAYELLKKDHEKLKQFTQDYKNLHEGKLNRQWAELVFNDKYLPSLYRCLSEVAYISKVSLIIGTTFKLISFRDLNRRLFFWSYNHGRQVIHSFKNFKVDSTYIDNIIERDPMAIMLNSGKKYNNFVTNIDLEKEIAGNNDYLENEIIASQQKKPVSMDSIRYMHLLFIRSNPCIKLERMYIAIKLQQLDFSCLEDSILIKRTLFEISEPINIEGKVCTLLEWTSVYCPLLIHELGLLCIQKALGMRFRLTQHQAIGEILEVVFGLLTFYSKEDYKLELITKIVDIYEMLKAVLSNPSKHLKESTLLYLNAYLVISMSAKPILIETETVTLLSAFFSIQKYKVKGLELDYKTQLQVNASSFGWIKKVDEKIQHNQSLLNDLVREFFPHWECTHSWTKSPTDSLFISGEYSIKPLLGIIYFKNQPITGLPDDITQHASFKDYLGKHSFAVIPGTRIMNNHEVVCYFSVEKEPPLRLTPTKEFLFIDEYIENVYHSYIPAEQLSKQAQYPRFFCEQPNNEMPLRHWLLNDNFILIKNQHRQILYKWNLSTQTVTSLVNGGYVVPYEHMHASYFKKWLERIESLQWVEIIVKHLSNSSTITIDSLHFLRLGLHFDYKNETFISRQIHNYSVAQLQLLNTLHGFSNYLILENETINSIAPASIKVIIPHRIIKSSGLFYINTVHADLTSIRSPTYFVYDMDQKTGLLKANNISAQLYLALIYYCSASLNINDVSQCNAYHLARENLELCWKDQVYDDIELDIIEQLLSDTAMRDLHCCRVALYLKVISLLINSVRLAFLYHDEQSRRCIKKSELLLSENEEKYSNFFSVYIQNRYKIFARIRLSAEEEQSIKDRLLITKKIDLNHFDKDNLIRSYKEIYGLLFCNEKLKKTPFIEIFLKNIDLFNFCLETTNFSAGIKQILFDFFTLQKFINLYKIAKFSEVSILKYRYLLHHLVLKSVSIDNSDVYMMLARALLLVAQNPIEFPEPPSWFDKINFKFELSKRSLTEEEILTLIPENQNAREIIGGTSGKKTPIQKNKEIWLQLQHHDLNSEDTPLLLPIDQVNFTLKYEDYIDFGNSIKSSVFKKEMIRKQYLKAARNNAMYKFFVDVLKQCDNLKLFSKIGRRIVSMKKYTLLTIELKIELPPFPRFEDKSLETLSKEDCNPILPIDVSKYFYTVEDLKENSKFLFESQKNDSCAQKGCQNEFYSELEISWRIYDEETNVSYKWINSNSLKELKRDLQTQYFVNKKEAQEIWNSIDTQFKSRPNNQTDQYFALQWYSGQAIYYHNGNLIALLNEPENIKVYNPNCFSENNAILKKIIDYVRYEINKAKIIRALSYCEQYKQIKNESEKFSILQTLVSVLLETLDPLSYKYPHWLLYQLENNIILRSNQCELISEMLDQKEKAMYQLNMGEGKSSVILPLLSYNLADGKKFLRINVLYSLLHTMKDILRQLFSGLIRKRVYLLPFYRDTDISKENLILIDETLKTCQLHHHILLVTPEHRLCLQSKLRELILENHEQIGATNVFDWKTYRNRVQSSSMNDKDLSHAQKKYILNEQDENLKTFLYKEQYIDNDNRILKVPTSGQIHKAFTILKEKTKEQSFHEWSYLNAAYLELLRNSTACLTDCREKLKLFYEIDEIPAIDLLDESDEILRHGTEVNYTIGNKYVFDGGELRWHIPQFFLKNIFCNPLIHEIIIAGKAKGFTVFNDKFSLKGVPFIQFLNKTYYEYHIKPLLIEDFFLMNLPTFRKHDIMPNNFKIDEDLISLKMYIAGQLPRNIENKIKIFLSDKGWLRDILFIAKGWLSHGILYRVLNAKYRVEYGLYVDFKGQLIKPMAVPFRGKDTPSQRSEFSHPDILLGYTILCYLYEGLNQQQLKETLIRLKSKFSFQVADEKLRKWAEISRNWIEPQINIGSFPPLILQSFEYIDLSYELCLQELHKFISGNYECIFFYLNHFVLLKEAMQYRKKISANAHSLVGFDSALGFSGTDDRKLTLPFQVKSLRSESEKGTDGKLLFVLTQERNRSYHSLQIDDTLDLLQQLCHYVKFQPDCHALIDAGALVTGMTNYEVALFLLTNLSDTFQGILFFSDEKNSLMVLTREKMTIPFQNFYLDKQYLFAYLDDIHTRGTDIKLPLNCQAILTIGLNMEKDKLMQAAMRLRQLAQKQSVSLWGTQAVTLAIAKNNSIDASQINSFEVIKWVTHNTIEHINKDLFSVALRKINFEFLKIAKSWLKEAPTMLDTLISFCQEIELFYLDDFYALSPQYEDLESALYCYVNKRLKIFWTSLEEELKKKQITDINFFQNKFNQASKTFFEKRLSDICEKIAVYLQHGYVHTSLDNDQEKEIEEEIEIMQKQSDLLNVEDRLPMKEEILWNVELIKNRNFWNLLEGINILMPLEAIQDYIHLPAGLESIEWHPDIYMTPNYLYSVKCKPGEYLDNYLRPVDVVLIHRVDESSTAILLSGQEASLIKSTCCTDLGHNLLVHLYDMNGPTQLPVGSVLSKQEQKLFTVIKLFAGECQYSSLKEINRLAKRVGRLYPTYFTNSKASCDNDCSQAIFGNLIENGYLNYAGIMTRKLFDFLRRAILEESLSLQLTSEYQSYSVYTRNKLIGIYNKLIVNPSFPLNDSHATLWKWIATRRRLKDYSGSHLEMILNGDQMKFEISV